MNRNARRLQFWHDRKEATFDPEMVHTEAAIRARTARRVRTNLRRLEPVAMLTPRWTVPQGFLEDIALDLAVGEPAIGCRTVSFRPLLGRQPAEAWNFILRVIGDLGSPGWHQRALPMVVDRRGFYNAAEMLLDEAHQDAPDPVALLAHSCETLPVEVLEDLALVWARYAERAREDRRCTILLAGSVDSPALDVGGAVRIDLSDFAEAEAAAALVMQVGAIPPRLLEKAARFSGGVPALVDALGHGTGRGAFPSLPEDMLRTMGPVGEELRAAVQSALTSPEVAERLYELMLGEPLVEEPSVDRDLMMAGLLRRTRELGEPKVELRTPAIAAAF
ncbi:hypothetical protein LBMAG42_11510 [Deltaproteobacteria bacterium]|nr:hypothetical protein LBMAG42_11510 [Deltaproteobacteria bacterium]